MKRMVSCLHHKVMRTRLSSPSHVAHPWTSARSLFIQLVKTLGCGDFLYSVVYPLI